SAAARAGLGDVAVARHIAAHRPRGFRRMRTHAGAVADIVGAGVPVVAARHERGRLALVAGFVARRLAVRGRRARFAGVAGAVARLARVGAVAEDTVVAGGAVGLELPDAAPDVVAVIAVRTLVSVEAAGSLPHELAVELAAAEREVAVDPAGALGPRG